ncbi:secreted RxLR effector protein 161-like [Cornus florida]|uniref:secreted RxLR effector protein 161-like n=1 Tax=Cornus florida TaxID=4283 RepID=UPI00289C315F|nr:secreted RxLR effector protein 161-like [Cornus florida]
MWYNRLSDYLLKEGYVNNHICPCIFTNKSESGFVIVAVYVDDLNLVGTLDEIEKTATYLKKEFEMKDLGKTKFCLGLQIIFVLKDDEELIGPEVPYLSAIGALLYLVNCTRPDIIFSVNLLARYSSAPTRRHWNGIKHILRYLRGTTDMGLFYSKAPNSQLIGYADAGYLFDPQKTYSQTGYTFTCGDTAISWRSMKQTMIATSSNHSEILALHKASRECI